MTLELVTLSAQETERVGEVIGSRVRGGEFIALEGELGAGKTCLVRGLARGMGLDSTMVSSPTFVIRQEYVPDAAEALRLVHVDAYRLHGAEELESIGWDELLEAPGAVVAVEWPQRVASALPDERLWIRLAHAGPDSRRIVIEGGARYGDIVDALRAAAESSGHGAEQSESRCPACGCAVTPDVPAFPFCSPRCRMADLNRWFTGEYRVSRPIESVDDDLNTD